MLMSVCEEQVKLVHGAAPPTPGSLHISAHYPSPQAAEQLGGPVPAAPTPSEVDLRQLQQDLARVTRQKQRHQLPLVHLTDACVHGDTVGKGASSTAFAVSSIYFHDVVFKTGVLGQLAVEGNLQAQVHHPGIVQAISLVLPKDSHAHFHQPAWLAMDRHGGSLHQTLTQFPQGLQAKEVLHKAHQLASALLWAHTAGVVHQDLHTQNVLNSRDGHSWLLADFGQACSTTQEDNPSKATVLSRIGCGKGIEAPEVAQQWMSSGQYTVAPPQDIWALGLLLNKASGGQPPLEHLEAIRQTHVNQDFKAAVNLEEDQRDLVDLQYLANLLTSGGSYATHVQVCRLPGEEYDLLRKIINGCLVVNPEGR